MSIGFSGFSNPGVQPRDGYSSEDLIPVSNIDTKKLPQWTLSQKPYEKPLQYLEIPDAYKTTLYIFFLKKKKKNQQQKISLPQTAPLFLQKTFALKRCLRQAWW